MTLQRWIRWLRSDGTGMADAAAGLDLDERVPTCPEWDVRQLLRHTGWVHRWARKIVGEALSSPPDRAAVVPGGWPPDDELLGWFGEGHHLLVSALEEASDDLDCWTMMEIPEARSFWARRQAHETAIHRADAESVAGAITPFSADQAVDGIDELLVFFITRPGIGPRSARTRHLRVVATDTEDRWTVRFGPDSSWGSVGDNGRADCTVSGTSSDLYPYLWHRAQPPDIEISGDREVMRFWADASF